MKPKFARRIFEKYTNAKFHENPSSGSRDVPSGKTDGQTDMTKLIVAFRSLANPSRSVTLSGFIIYLNVRDSVTK